MSTVAKDIESIHYVLIVELWDIATTSVTSYMDIQVILNYYRSREPTLGQLPTTIHNQVLLEDQLIQLEQELHQALLLLINFNK